MTTDVAVSGCKQDLSNLLFVDDVFQIFSLVRGPITPSSADAGHRRCHLQKSWSVNWP